MIIQFPTPYPDELLYSVLARYHIRSGNVFWKHTLEDLFGKRSISATAFLPSGIGSLVQNLPQNTMLTGQKIIEKHTMYPFYTVFLPTEKAQSIYESMMSDDGRKIYMQSGIMASAIPQNQYLKYCSKCSKADISRYGELYWHRLHQLPGNLICPKHGLWLENSKVRIIFSNKHAFMLPTTSNCDLTKERKVGRNVLERFKEVLLQAECLLSGHYESQSFSHFTRCYRNYLIDQGFANHNGRVNQKKLHDDFRVYYPEELLKSLHVDVGQWLFNISRKHRKSFHPYYHILMLIFLGLNVQAVFKTNSFKNNPFGKPKWPCLNVVCSEYKRNVVEEVTTRMCEKTKKPIGRFTCTICGFSYTRKGKDQGQEDRYKYTRIMDFGSLWKKELQSLLEENLSYREIARRLNVDPGTVIKYEKKVKGIKNLSKEEPKQNKCQTINSHRQVWLQLQKDNPGLSKTELRHQKPSTFTFLYRNDREWLNNNSPNLQNRNNENNRVNWKNRDQEMFEKVQKATKEIKYRSGKPKRVTVKSIGDAIGEKALLEQQLHRMPKTKMFIDGIRESEKDFRLRRVKHVIEEISIAGEEIIAWKVLRKANIKKEFSNEVQDYIELKIKYNQISCNK